MSFWNPDSIRIASGGTWLVRPAQIELPKDRPADLPLPELHARITGVSTDTRTIRAGQMFIALRGENFDGHGFVADAIRGGAPVVVVDDGAGVPTGGALNGCGVLRVADTGRALLKLAGAYRESLKRTRVIAVCGSNGKTTTTRLIEHLLSRTMRGTASQKSFNNAVGVPLTILSARENDQYLVCEVGTNHPGEIKTLAEVVRPDIAVITSIGREHLEGFGDVAGVAAEEAVVLKHLRPGGWAVVTADAPELAEPLRVVRNLITFGRAAGATLRLTEAHHEVEGDRPWLAFTVNGRQRYRTPLVGEHNALNAIAALAVARRLGVDDQRASGALLTAGSAEMRLSIQRIAAGEGTITVLDDAYNANPDSMIAGVRTLLALRESGVCGPCGVGGIGGKGRAVAILGEMLEMGGAAEEGHRAVAEAMGRAGDGTSGGFDLAILVGEGMRHAERRLREMGWPEERVRWFASSGAEDAPAIAALLGAGDLALLKGSRGVRLERVLGAIRAACEGERGPERSSRERPAAGVGAAGVQVNATRLREVLNHPPEASLAG